MILSELDFPTDGHVWLAQERRGAELVWLRSPDGLTIPLEAYDAAIDERTAVVMVNRVLYRSSAIMDAKMICAIARERGALSFVDDYHGIGILPLDLHDLGCDLYTAGTLKWLLGGPGMVFLYARRELLPTLEPAVTGWFATRDPFSFDTQHLDYHHTARRLEHGTPPAPVFFIAQGGLDIISEVTPGRIRERQGELTDHVIARADEAGLPVRTPRERSARGGVSTSASDPTPGGSATRCSTATSAPTSAATGCGSAHTSSTTRPTSTAASRSSAPSSSPWRTPAPARPPAAPCCSRTRDRSTADRRLGSRPHPWLAPRSSCSPGSARHSASILARRADRLGSRSGAGSHVAPAIHADLHALTVARPDHARPSRRDRARRRPSAPRRGSRGIPAGSSAPAARSA